MYSDFCTLYRFAMTQIFLGFSYFSFSVGRTLVLWTNPQNILKIDVLAAKTGPLVDKNGASNGFNSCFKAVALLSFIACIETLSMIRQNMAVPVESGGKLY